MSALYFLIMNFLIGRKKLKDYQVFVPFLLLLMVELLPINIRFLKGMETEEEYYKPDDVVRSLSNDKTLFRVFPLRYERSNDGILQKYGIYNIGGYGPNPLRLYQNYIGAGKSVMFQPSRLIKNQRLIDLLNVKYIIDYNLPDDISHYPDEIKQQFFVLYQFFSRYEIVYKTKKYTIYNNPFACERVYFVHHYVVEKDEEKMLEKISDIEFSYEDSVFLFEKPSYENYIKKPNYKIDIIAFNPNIIELKINTDSPGILIFSENWHPTWNVSVDDKKERLLRVNYLFRGVELKEGEHIVKMYYDSKEERIGITLSFIGYVIFISGFFIRKKDKD
jgi:hypothetical protein